MFRSTVLRVMSPTRFLCATMIGVSLDGFDPPPLGLLVCNHYTTNGWFRSTSSNLPVCSHYTSTTRLIYAPPSHISVIDFTMSRSTISMTFYPVGFIIINPINHLNDFIIITLIYAPFVFYKTFPSHISIANLRCVA